MSLLAAFDAAMTLQISPALPRTALVTGGAGRVGRAVCLALAAAGFATAIQCERAGGAGEALAEAVRAGGGRAAVLVADLADEVAVAGLFSSAVRDLGPVGVLVNHAAAGARDGWEDATRESWMGHHGPNLRAPWVLTQALARGLPASAEGAAFNVFDPVVGRLTADFVSHTVAQAGLWALTRQMALALAPRIRVNAIGLDPARGGGVLDAAGLERAVIALLSLRSITGQIVVLGGETRRIAESGPG